MMSQVLLLLLPLQLLLTVIMIPSAQAYVPPETRQKWKSPGYGVDKALEEVTIAANLGKHTPELFGAVKFLDRFSSIHYSTMEEKEALLERANGSWELRLALNSDKDQEFYPHPEFRAFAMAFVTISPEYFGKGIAPDTSFSFVALGGPSTRNIKTRQVYMNYEDFYINGFTVPGWDLSYFTRGFKRNWVSAAEKKRPKMAFTVVCASDKTLVVRGNKTGGMAIFRRIEEDMRPAAYGDLGI